MAREWTGNNSPNKKAHKFNTEDEQEFNGDTGGKSRPVDWSALLAGSPASEEFMNNVEKLPAQERGMWSSASQGIEWEGDVGVRKAKTLP
ncbi:MAG: hypothetical protein WCF17_10330 [Terracidiphilus sp.]